MKKLVEALKEGEITSVESPHVIEFIHTHTGNIETQNQLAQFLRQLIRYWPFFEDIPTIAENIEERKFVS